MYINLFNYYEPLFDTRVSNCYKQFGLSVAYIITFADVIFEGAYILLPTNANIMMQIA